MHRPLTEILEEINCPHIKKSSHKPFKSVLTASVQPWMMFHRDLGCSEPVHCRQRWHHSMHLAIHGKQLHNFPAVTFEAAVVIVQFHLIYPAENEVKNPAGQNLMPRVAPISLPTCYHVK